MVRRNYGKHWATHFWVNKQKEGWHRLRIYVGQKTGICWELYPSRVWKVMAYKSIFFIYAPYYCLVLKNMYRFQTCGSRFAFFIPTILIITSFTCFDRNMMIKIFIVIPPLNQINYTRCKMTKLRCFVCKHNVAFGSSDYRLSQTLLIMMMAGRQEYFWRESVKCYQFGPSKAGLTFHYNFQPFGHANNCSSLSITRPSSFTPLSFREIG